MARQDDIHTASDVISDVITRSVEAFDDDRRRAVRARIMTHVYRDSALVRSRMVFRRAVAAVTVTATMLGGVSYAAAVSLPGDMLYGIKRLSEDIALEVLPEGALQTRLLFTIATRRADEIAAMTAGEVDDALVNRTIDQFRATTSAAIGAGAGSEGEATASETRLREHVDEAPQPVKQQLQKALESAEKSPSGQMDQSDAQELSGQSDAGTDLGTGGLGSGQQSPDTTGPADSSRH